MVGQMLVICGIGRAFIPGTGNRSALGINRALPYDSVETLDLGNFTGIKHEDCFEKDELVRRLAIAVAAITSTSNNSPINLAQETKPLVCLAMTMLRSTSYLPGAIKEDIILPLTIQGEKLQFVIDTGSTTTLIRPDIAWDVLGIPRSSSTTSAGMGATASFQNAPSIVLESVELNSYKCKPLQAVVVDLSTNVHPSLAGIIGMNMLSQFDVEFDFVAEKLAFYAAGEFQRSKSLVRDATQLVTSAGSFYVPYIEVQIGSSSLQTAILDIGSSLCVASSAAAKEAGAIEEIGQALGGFGIQGSTAMSFGSSTLDIVFSSSNDKVPLIKVRGAKFAIGDLLAMKIMGAQVILGLNAFRKSRLLISMSTMSIYLKIT